jgi:hypothetical protein
MDVQSAPPQQPVSQPMTSVQQVNPQPTPPKKNTLLWIIIGIIVLIFGIGIGMFLI